MSASLNPPTPPPLPVPPALPPTPDDGDGAGPQVVARMPPTGRKFPCRKCGARLDFDPSSRALKCPYCGFEEAIEPSAEKVAEQDWDAFWKNLETHETLLSGHSSEVSCTACGAVVLLDDKVATDKCPYCSAHYQITQTRLGAHAHSHQRYKQRHAKPE